MALSEADRRRYPLLTQYEGRLKDVDEALLPDLCAELRRFLIEYVSKSGGHFSSNMGVVELTVALHRAFDLKTDRLVFDVGHQCYAHKIISGRMGEFDTLRKKGGLSGFPRPSESEYDAFIAGHASAAISAALGLARASRLTGRDNYTVALVGDGAMGGGLAYEGLNDAGGSGERLVVVLNDNGMSIGRSVGALAKLLMKIRIGKDYRNAKEIYHKVVERLPKGEDINRILTGVKNSVKQAILPGTFFELMGFEYIGPVDGHDAAGLCAVLERAKSFKMPVLVHVLTKKGKGYRYSEKNPAGFHGIPPFDASSGACPPQRGEVCCSKVFGKYFVKMAERDKRVVAVTAAMPVGTGLAEFKRRFPERYFDVGIAEGHAVALAAGMAKGGLRPYVAIYSTFLQRAYDQLLHDVGLLGLPVVFCADRAGLSGEDGETHQGLYDMAMFSAVPGMEVYMPSSEAELMRALDDSLNATCPTAIRYPRGAFIGFDGDTFDKNCILLKKGERLTIAVAGRLVPAALETAERLAGVGVLKLNRVFPLDKNEILPLVAEKILVCEECAEQGSVYQNLCAALSEDGGYTIYPQHCGNAYAPHASVEEQLAMYGLDADGIYARAKEILG